jgi:hypothetical protein
MTSIVAVFPDFQSEIIARTVTNEREVAEWILTGINSKPLKPSRSQPLSSLSLELLAIARSPLCRNAADSLAGQKYSIPLVVAYGGGLKSNLSRNLGNC